MLRNSIDSAKKSKVMDALSEGRCDRGGGERHAEQQTPAGDQEIVVRSDRRRRSDKYPPRRLPARPANTVTAPNRRPARRP